MSFKKVSDELKMMHHVYKSIGVGLNKIEAKLGLFELITTQLQSAMSGLEEKKC